MHEKSIELLNKAVAEEMSAIHQYMYYHFHCDDQGYELLAALFRKTAIEEMGHVELLAERVLFLDGDVDMVASDQVQQIHDVGKMLHHAAEMEKQSAEHYNQWANQCSQNADAGSRKIFEQLVADEERHFDQYNDEIDNFERFGEKYLPLQSIQRSKSASAGGGEA